MRRDPMAMKPFCGYHFGGYFAHWLSFDKPGAKLPKVFHVNWFRKDAGGRFLWPGFGENIRVLEWIVGQVTDEAGFEDAVAGRIPLVADLELDTVVPSARLRGIARRGLWAVADRDQERLRFLACA